MYSIKIPERSNTLLFKIGVFIYKKTGYLIGYCRLVERDFIMDNIDSIAAGYQNRHPDDEQMPLKTFIGMHIGMFQARVGLTTTFSSKMLKTRFKLRTFLRRKGIM